MQLTKKNRIGAALASASCALLGVQQASAAETDELGWKIDAALLYYTEQDRVQATEPTIKAQKTFANEQKLNLNLVVDTLTGASPNGAAPTDVVQTFTRPSGVGSYTVPAGDIPLDDTFHDTRVQIGAGWEAPINRLTRYNIGANFSNEYDYTSLSVNGGLSRDFNKKNTTLSIGMAYAADSLSPEGGIPTPLASMAAPGAVQPRDGNDDTKDVVDVVIGLTQVITPRLLMQFNIGLSESSGYLNDPFKIVSIVDANGRPLDYIYENRPDSRSKQTLFWSSKYHLPMGDTLDVSYRFMTDDWGIDSHTLDFHYRWNITDTVYLQPHLRWYQQSAADFYRHSLAASEPLPHEVSADYRLAEFDATTLGLKFGYLLGENKEFSARLESYQQRGDSSPSDAIGVQKNYDMFPDLDALIFQVGYSFSF